MAKAQDKVDFIGSNDDSSASFRSGGAPGGISLGLSFEPSEDQSTDYLDPEVSPPFMCVYDFDQTITTVHSYNEILARKSSHGIDKKSSGGDGGGEDEESSEVFIQMKGSEYLELHIPDKDVLSWFGDANRQKLLREHLEKMRLLGVECRILSLNEVKTLRHCLRIAKLEKYFHTVCGSDTPEFKKFSRKKNGLLKRWKRANHLEYDDLVFVDDDRKNIKSVNAEKTCLTVRVQKEEKSGSQTWGMQRVHYKSIERHFENRKKVKFSGGAPSAATKLST